MDLFSSQALKHAPLAERMRPRNLDEYVGQEHLVGEGKLLRRAILEDKLPSMIFWGPPGVGKTALAAVIAASTRSFFERLSAVTSGVADIKRVVAEAENRLKLQGERTVLFIDEVHRWNKSQQDALLPHVERGTVILIGATTENPSFEVNSALLSRSRVFTLERLSTSELETVLERALSDVDRGLGKRPITLTPEAREFLLASAGGDARLVLGTLESASTALPESGGELTLETVEEALAHKALLYDKAADEHYNVISAFIKSMRGGSVDGSLYWLHRMLEAGEDPKFIARRLVVFASEDVGLADPGALPLATAAFQAVTTIGLPEAAINLSHATSYLARAPKSRSAYEAGGAAQRAVRDHLHLPVPLQLRNAPTKLMKDSGYGAGYTWDVRSDQFKAIESYLPDELQGSHFYEAWKTDEPPENQA